MGIATTRRRGLFAVLAMILVAGAACGGGGDDEGSPGTTVPAGSGFDAVVEAARKEGKLTVFQPGDPKLHDKLVTAMREKYGIELAIQGGAASELQPRFDEERKVRSGEVDMFFSANPTYMLGVVKAGDFAPLTSPRLEHETFKKFPQLRPDPSAVVVVADAPLIAWNTQKVKDPLKGYDDLVARSSEFAGELAATDIYANFVYEMYGYVEQGVGQGWIEKMLGLKPQFFTSAVPLTQSVAAGENKVAIGAMTSVYNSVKKSGAPIEGILDRKAPYSVNLIGGITDWAKHPNAAQVYIDFLISPEGQAIMADKSLSIYENQPFALAGPEAMVFPKPEFQTAEFRDAMKKRWEAAKK